MTSPKKDVNLASSPSPSQRLKSLDVMRGMTIACMIIVNNSGGPESYAQLRHSPWNGLTVCDLVFPFFLFIMGITTYLSMSRMRCRPLSDNIRKILKRTVLILLICWALHWFGNVCSGIAWSDFSHLRLTGVLTRIALCYCVMSLMSLRMKEKAMVVTAFFLLAGYGVALCLHDGYTNGLGNINAVVDRWLLPVSHLYAKQPVDPEGLLGTVPSIAHTIIGYCFGKVLKDKTSLSQKLLRLFVYGGLILLGGWVLSGILPLNKRIWSPSYVLVTCGMAAMLLAMLSYFIDLNGKGNWFRFFEAFGVNPLFLYVMAEALGELLGSSATKDSVYGCILSVIGDACMSSAIYSIALMLLMGAIAYPLYLKKIYIKI